MVHGSTDCSILSWQGLDTKGAEAVHQSRQWSRSGKPLGKCAETSQSCTTSLQKERCCPYFWQLVFMGAQIWWLHTHGLELIAQQQANTRYHCHRQSMHAASDYMGKVWCVFELSRSSKFWLKSKVFGKSLRLENKCFQMSVPVHLTGYCNLNSCANLLVALTPEPQYCYGVLKTFMGQRNHVSTQL